MRETRKTYQQAKRVHGDRAPGNGSRRGQARRRGPRNAGPRGRNVVLAKAFVRPSITNDGVPSPARSTWKTRSRTWAPSWSSRWPPRPTTSPATAPPPQPSWRRPSSSTDCATSRPAPTRSRGTGHQQGRGHGVRGAAGVSHPGIRPERIAPDATVSSRDEEIGVLVGEAMSKVGHDGVVSVEESST